MLKGRQRLVSLRSVFVALVCLCILTPRKVHGQRCSREIIDAVGKLIKDVKEMKSFDCRLYTPTMDDYEKCPGKTLSCFAKEANVLTMEWTNRTSLPSVPLPKRLIKLITAQEKGCPQCEGHTEEAAETFLTTLCNVLQRMNAEKCVKPTKPRRRRKKRRTQRAGRETITQA